jgi:uncharacterized protein YkwD
MSHLQNKGVSFQTADGIMRLFMVFSLSLLSACGGGGAGTAGGNSSGSGISLITAKVMDGYILGATVCLDINGNGMCEANEPGATQGANGTYALSVPSGTNPDGMSIIAEVPKGAMDSDTGIVTSAYSMFAPAVELSPGAVVVSPLTTLVSLYAKANGTSTQNAAAAVVTALGLPAGSNLYQDYMASSLVSSAQIHHAAQAVNSVIQNSSIAPASGAKISVQALNAVLSTSAGYVQTVLAASSVSPSLLDAAAVSAASTTGSLVSFLPVPAYSSDDLNLYGAINAIRQNAGAGLLAENAALDAAAANHAGFLINNNLLNAPVLTGTISVGGVSIAYAHYEDSSLPGFTGSTPAARALAAGYDGPNVSESLSFGPATGAACGAAIEDSVYHLSELMLPFTDIGISYNGGKGSGPVCDVEVGAGSVGQYPAAGNWAYYPSQSGVPPTFYNQTESPDPAPDLVSATGIGHPIVFSLYNQSATNLAASSITLHAFSLQDASGNPVAARVLAQAGVASDGTAVTYDNNLPMPGILVLLPTSPLTPNTIYTATFSATVNGVAISQAWSFATGSAN